MNKTSFKRPFFLLKFAFLAVLTFIISCSGGEQVSSVPKNGAPTVSGGFALTLQALPFYTRLPDIMVQMNTLTENDEKKLKGVQLWVNDSGCESAMDGYADRASFLTTGAQVSLDLNQDNLVTYRVVYEDDNLGPCVPVGTVAHDDTAPSAVTITGGPLKSRDQQVFFPINNIANDVKDLRFYFNASPTVSSTVSAALWRNGQGFITVPANASTSITVKAVDNAGNESAASSAFSVVHKNTPPNLPSLAAPVESKNGTVDTNPSVTISGTVDADVVTIKVFKDVPTGTPVNSLTSVQFNVGSSVALTNGVVNNFYLVAVDEFGNESSPKQFTILSSQTPVYSYALAATTIYPSRALTPNSSVYLKLEIINASFETTLNAPVRVNNVTVSESSPNIALDNTKGCPVTGISPSVSCEIYLTVTYTSTGIKTENLVVNLNGTTIPVVAEFEVLSPVINSLSGTQLAALGNFIKVDLSGKIFIFANGVVKASDLSNPIMNTSLASDLAAAEIFQMGYYFLTKSGKVNMIDYANLDVIELPSTRSYSPGSIQGASRVGAGYLPVVMVQNSGGTKDILIYTKGEIRDLTIDSNLSLGQRVYYRSGSTLRSFGDDLTDSLAPGVSIAGDLASETSGIYFIGDSGNGNSLHRVNSSGLADLGELSGAQGFSKLKDRIYRFQIGGNFGLFSVDEVFSNANSSFAASDVRPTADSNNSEYFISANIQTSSGNKTILSKIMFPENSRLSLATDSSNYGGLSSPIFDREGDYFIYNKGATSIGVARLTEDYSSITELETISTPAIETIFSAEGKAVFINTVTNKGIFNVIDISEGLVSKYLSYYAPTDIQNNSALNVIKISETDFVIYYLNNTSGYSFKTIRVY